jgi:biotin synthase-like enzyme
MANYPPEVISEAKANAKKCREDMELLTSNQGDDHPTPEEIEEIIKTMILDNYA